MDENYIRKIIKNIYDSSLGCRDAERLLIFSDFLWLKDSSANITIFKIFKEAAKESGIEIIEYVYEDTGRHGAEPPQDFWRYVFGQDFLNVVDFQQIKEKKVSVEQLLTFRDRLNFSHLPQVVIALSYYSTSHTNFRKLLNSLDARYASIPRLEESMFYGALDIDFNTLEETTKKLKAEIEDKSSVFINSSNGTEISIEFSGRAIQADTGNLKEKGSFGNLPAGEVYVAPVEDKTNGRFIVEYGLGKKLDPPLEIYVEKGRVTKMIGNEEMKSYLNKLFETNDSNAVVAELGFGTNKNAKDLYNVLEAEKIYNTCHIALGDNSTFGGNNIATAHIDFVILNPELRWK